MSATERLLDKHGNFLFESGGFEVVRSDDYGSFEGAIVELESGTLRLKLVTERSGPIELLLQALSDDREDPDCWYTGDLVARLLENSDDSQGWRYTGSLVARLLGHDVESRMNWSGSTGRWLKAELAAINRLFSTPLHADSVRELRALRDQRTLDRWGPLP